MDFGLTDEQEMLKKSARDFLQKELPKKLVRQLDESDIGYSPELWQKMSDLGWTGLPFPGEYGGGDGSFLDLVVLLEAMACGLPPILSDIPALRDTLQDSGLGLLVDFTDPRQAARHIEEYVSNPKAQQDRLSIREYVVSKMSSAVCADTYLDLLREVSGESSGA